MECLQCNFFCKLRSDYGRHLKTEYHTIMITKQNEMYHYIHYKAIHQKKLNKLNIQFTRRAIYPRVLYELKEKLNYKLIN
jgi:hypothetical protein